MRVPFSLYSLNFCVNCKQPAGPARVAKIRSNLHYDSSVFSKEFSP